MTRTLTTGANALKQLYSYAQDKNYRLGTLKSGTTTTTNNNLQNITYTYDNVGNVLTIYDAAAAGGAQTQTFTYDPLDRVVSATATGGGTPYGAYALKNYGYANNGNLTSFEGVTQEYTDASHPHAVTKVGGTQKYWYDGNGNATKRVASDGTYEFVYDAENRLTQLKKAGSVISTFKYDGDGNRIWESTGGVTTIYLGNYYEWTSSTLKKYYYANGVRVAMVDGATLKYLLNDHLESTAITTSNTGARQTELRYFAYGKTRYIYGTPPTSFKYTGQRQQGNANELYFYGARWYDALVGRFLSPDTIVPQPGNPQSLNRYMYVQGNPLRLVDPSGMAECAANDSACWQAEWEWKNRWYEAHGWFWENGGWTRQGEARFKDEAILRDTMAELDIKFANLNAAWAFSEMSLIAQGIVALANKMGGFAQLGKRLPYGAFLMRAQHALFYYFDPSIDPYGHSIPGTNLLVFADELFAQDSRFVRGFAVHEIAHVIDYFNPFSNGTYIHQVVPMGTHLSDYAVQNNLHLEYWAEMVAIWVYGKSYQDQIPTPLINQALTVSQSSWIEHVLGWGW